MFGGTLNGQRVLVTGLGGAKGTWLGWYLLEAGVERVIGVDRTFGTPGGCFYASGLGAQERVCLCEMDIRDLDGLRATLERERVSCLVHLAAMAIVGECRERPLDTYAINVLGTATVLEAARLSPTVERIVVVTTDKVYRDKGGEPWREDDPLVASGPYAVSKACAEFLTRDYFVGYLQPGGKHLGVARAGNVLAPGDHHRGRIFVDVVLALAAGQAPVIQNPAFTRPYTYVGDTVSGYLSLLAQCDRPEVDGEAFNFGPQEAQGVPNGELATRICELWGSGIQWVRGEGRTEPFVHQSLDCTKADRILQWRPAYRLDQALQALVEWHKAHAQHPQEGALQELTVEHVRRHVAAARAAGIAWAQEAPGRRTGAHPAG
jgi:CDP-glucose 4,6-dehydratase